MFPPLTGQRQGQLILGKDAEYSCAFLGTKVEPCIENGRILNMDYFEALLNYLFQKEMKKDPKSNRIMIIESHPGSAGLLKQREALCQLMFEKF